MSSIMNVFKSRMAVLKTDIERRVRHAMELIDVQELRLSDEVVAFAPNEDTPAIIKRLSLDGNKVVMHLHHGDDDVDGQLAGFIEIDTDAMLAVLDEVLRITAKHLR